MKRYLILLILIFIFFFSFTPTPSHALWWMVYHKPAFKGKVIDAETKEPIEGAVVVVVYDKATIGLGAGALSSIINIREVLTDKEGMFRISSYTTIIQPFSVEDEAVFIIFKPGYGKFPHGQVYPPKDFWGLDPDKDFLPREDYFSEKTGAVKEAFFKEPWNPKAEMRKGHITFGIVELPKLKTREERIKAKPAPVGEKSDWKKQKKFIKAIREEWQYLTGKDPSKLYRWEDD